MDTLRVWPDKSKRSVELATLAWSNDGKILATVDAQHTVKLLDVLTGMLQHTLEEAGQVVCLSFSPDGKVLATAGQEKTVALWNTGTGKLIGPLEGHLCGVTFLADGKTLVSASIDGTALCWDLTGQRTDKLQAAKRLTIQELEEEWKLLREQRADQAYQAMLKLAADPKSAIPKLQIHLKPVAPIEARIIAQWVAELDDMKPAVRDKAMQELIKAGDIAWPLLNKVLENPPSLEMQTRVRQILAKDPGKQGDFQVPLAQERIWQVRSLELLERLDTPEARKLMQTLADGAPEAWLTQEAKMMLKRK